MDLLNANKYTVTLSIYSALKLLTEYLPKKKNKFSKKHCNCSDSLIKKFFLR